MLVAILPSQVKCFEAVFYLHQVLIRILSTTVEITESLKPVYLNGTQNNHLMCLYLDY